MKVSEDLHNCFGDIVKVSEDLHNCFGDIVKVFGRPSQLLWRHCEGFWKTFTTALETPQKLKGCFINPFRVNVSSQIFQIV